MTSPLPAGVDQVLLDALRVVALDAATEAGELLLGGRPAVRATTLDVGTKSSPTDVVTAMDRAAEDLLVDRLLGARPDDGLLGEEGSAREGTSGLRWVIDPLDGTVNYLYGLPQWGVAVLAEHTATGTPLVGVVVVPVLGETYVAVAGRGATRLDAHGEQVMRVSTCDDLAMALIGTGFGYRAERRAAQARVVAAMLPRVRDIRRGGAAAVDLCHVASGSLDGYYERGLQPWDLGAGGLVALEAGALLAGAGGGPPGEDLVVAAGPGIFGALRDAVLALRADTDEV